MSRLPKTGLDYFTLDVDMDQDDKLCMLEAELGELAFGRFIKLLMAIYREGYYKKWGEEEQLIFASKKNIPILELKNLVLSALNRNLFDKNLFEKYGILTSSGIQKRYIKASENRNQIVIHKLFTRVDINDFSEKIKSKINLVNSDIKAIKSDIKAIIPDSGTQSKAKERKGKQSNGPGIKSNLIKELSEKIKRLLEDNFLFDSFQYDGQTIKEITTSLVNQNTTDLGYVRYVLNQMRADDSVDNPEGYFLWAIKKGEYLEKWRGART